MDAEAWLAELRRIFAAGDWHALTTLRLRTTQPFADRGDPGGLRQLLADVAALGLDDARRRVLEAAPQRPFLDGLRTALAVAAERVAANPGVGAIYIEYFYDGGDACTANVFLCDQYIEDDDFWASEFDPALVVEGPDVPDTFRVDPDYDWPDLERQVAREYADAMAIAACLEAWQDWRGPPLPFGAAQHDHAITRVRPG